MTDIRPDNQGEEGYATPLQSMQRAEVENDLGASFEDLGQPRMRACRKKMQKAIADSAEDHSETRPALWQHMELGEPLCANGRRADISASCSY